jgi:cytochrome c biogenesis protein CcmG, thiol:disulfide interchange protein DsbE
MQSLRRIGALTLCLLALTPPWARAANKDALLDLAQFRGRVIYLDFWASWCAPCRESFPWMNRLQGALGHEGLVVIAVNVDRERADADRFLREHPAQFRILYDPDGLLPEKFGVRGMPTSFLIDRDGRIQSRHEGFLVRDRDALMQQIRTLVIAH